MMPSSRVPSWAAAFDGRAVVDPYCASRSGVRRHDKPHGCLTVRSHVRPIDNVL